MLQRAFGIKTMTIGTGVKSGQCKNMFLTLFLIKAALPQPLDRFKKKLVAEYIFVHLEAPAYPPG